MKHVLYLVLALPVAVLPGHAQSRGVLKPSDPVVIELKVPAEDALNVTSQYTVSSQGTVKVPMLDREIQAAGITANELARRIEAAYRAAEIYTNPTVNAYLHKPENTVPHVVIVGGEVKSGGQQVPLRDGMTLYAAITSAGGFTEFAKVKAVKLIRGNTQKVYDMRKLNTDGSNNPVLQDGDQIVVPQG